MQSYKLVKSHILWQYEEPVKIDVKITHVKQGKRDCVP